MATFREFQEARESFNETTDTSTSDEPTAEDIAERELTGGLTRDVSDEPTDTSTDDGPTAEDIADRELTGGLTRDDTDSGGSGSGSTGGSSGGSSGDSTGGEMPPPEEPAFPDETPTSLMDSGETEVAEAVDPDLITARERAIEQDILRTQETDRFDPSQDIQRVAPGAFEATVGIGGEEVTRRFAFDERGESFFDRRSRDRLRRRFQRQFEEETGEEISPDDVDIEEVDGQLEATASLDAITGLQGPPETLPTEEFGSVGPAPDTVVESSLEADDAETPTSLPQSELAPAAGGSVTFRSEEFGDVGRSPIETFGDFDFTIPEPLPGAGREPEDILRSTLEDVERRTDPAIQAVGDLFAPVGGVIGREATQRDVLTPAVTESIGTAVLPGAGGQVGRIGGELLAAQEPEVGEELGSFTAQQLTIGGAKGARDIATFPITAPLFTQESLEFGAKAVEETQAGRGKAFGERAGEAGLAAGERALQSAIENPIETSGRLGGSLIFSGGAIGAASRVSPTLGRVVSTGIQPGEELAIAAARRGTVSTNLATKVPGVRRGMIEGGTDRGQLQLGISRRSGELDPEDQLRESLRRFERGEAIRRAERRAERRILERQQELPPDDPVTLPEPEFRTVSRPEARTVSQGPDFSRSGPTRRQQEAFNKQLNDDVDLSPRERQLAARIRREAPDQDLRVAAAEEFADAPADPMSLRALRASRLAEPTVGDTPISPFDEPAIGTEPPRSIEDLRVPDASTIGGSLGLDLAAGSQSRLQDESQEMSLLALEEGASLTSQPVETELEANPETSIREREEVSTGVEEQSGIRSETRQDQRLEERLESRAETREETRLESRTELKTEPPRPEQKFEPPRIETRTEPPRFEAKSEPPPPPRREADIPLTLKPDDKKDRRLALEADPFEKEFGTGVLDPSGFLEGTPGLDADGPDSANLPEDRT